MSEMNPDMMAAEIAKVNEVMAKEEKNVEKAYSEIGKLYVALHASDYETEFKRMFDVIEQAEKTIRECRDRVRDIRGVVCCDKCGSDMPKGQAFCSVCGAALTTEAAAIDRENLVKCEVCGKYVAKDTSFCTSCGMPMKPIQERVAAPVVEEPVAEAVEEEIDKTVIAPAVFGKAQDTVVEEAVEQEPVAESNENPVQIVEPPVVDDLESTTAAQRSVAPAKICTRCGTAIREGMVFCTACGQRVDAPAPAPAATTKICKNCGKEIAANARFCIGCGSRAD